MLTLWHHVSRTCVSHGVVCLAALVRGLQAPSLLLTRYRLPAIFHRGSVLHPSANGARPLCRPGQPWAAGSPPPPPSTVSPKTSRPNTNILRVTAQHASSQPGPCPPYGTRYSCTQEVRASRTEQSSWNLSQATRFDWSHHLRYCLSPWR